MSNVGRMNAAGKVKRDAEIVKDRARGFTWQTIAERHGVAERHARRVFSEYLEGMFVQHDSDPFETAREMLARYDSLIEDLALIAAGTAQDAVRLGALRSKLAALNQRFEFQRAVGLIPPTAGRWAQEVDVRRASAAILEIFNRYGLPEEAESDLIAALRPAPAEAPGRLQSV
jgi:hypothetical protein